jgi:hypothetical protein
MISPVLQPGVCRERPRIMASQPQSHAGLAGKACLLMSLRLNDNASAIPRGAADLRYYERIDARLD